MMNNNKILTVSYGTFSCTLEGFEDSFGTMKAIAEYFRDLAADDRYFGAEPPQPDAEMLARIAEKEVSRRVQARQQNGKIVLSALAETPDGHGARLQRGPAPTAPVSPPQQAEAPAPQEDVISIDTAPIDLTEIGSEPVDIEISEIEPQDAGVSVEAPLAAQTDDAQTAAAEDTDEEVDTAEDGLDEDQDTDIEDESASEEEVDAFFADDAGDDDEADEEQIEEMPQAIVSPAPQPTAAPAHAPDSIAAKLERIRAVVAQQQDAAEDEDDYLEDEHAESTPTLQDDADDSALIARARSDIEDALDADDAMELDEADEDEDEVTAILDRLAREGAPDTPRVQAPQPVQAEKQTTSSLSDLEDEDDEEDDSAERSVSSLFGAADEEDAAAEEDDRVSDTYEEEDEDEEDGRMAQDAAQKDEPAATAPVEPAAPRPATVMRTRVIKVKRADLEAAIAKGELEEYDDEAEDEAETARDVPALDDLAPARRPTTALSPEDEAELARELTALEEDISANADRNKAEAHEEETAPVAKAAPRKDQGGSPARALLPDIDDENDTDVNRLLAETDHQMDEPESATRRDAFAHLRAAVMAKKADSTIDDDDAEHGDNVYRRDLAKVVRPRRPVSTESRTGRPDDARPAPLKLVAEQRIDVPKAKAAGPVRPRRVSTESDMDAGSDTGEGFAAFAADRGASTLPQLLEAAAAYMSFVEGREQFSRPQLMTKVRQAGGQEEFTREEGLRSFGQLLRAGKIEKIKGGRFTVSEDIGYRPDQRAAG